MAYRHMDLGDTSLPKHSGAWKYHLNRIITLMKKYVIPMLKYLAQAVIGLIGLSLIFGALWVLTVGAMRTGVYVGHDKLGYDMPTNWGPGPEPIITWGLGIIVITGPFWLAKFGRFFINLLPGQD